MDRENYFGKYSLSDNSLDKLSKAIENQTTNNDLKIRDAWERISWEEPEKTIDKAQDHDDNYNNMKTAPSQTKISQDGLPETTQATQYGFTQMERSNSNFESSTSTETITDFIYESLERPNGKLEMNSMTTIKASELSIIINNLSKKLTHRGIYNLCNSICDMKIEFSERIISFVCKDVIFNTIISLEEPSRLLNASITECLKRFPDDVENFIFIPALNSDLKETTTILSITSSLDVQQKHRYISGLSAEVKDLQQWHIGVLQDLIIPNLDDNTKEKVLSLLWKKSYEYSKDKNYGKLILNLLKTNPPTTLQQKYFFEEIVAVHNTLFKRLIDKILETIPIG